MFPNVTPLDHLMRDVGIDTEKEHPLVLAGIAIQARREANKAIRAAQQRARDTARRENANP